MGQTGPVAQGPARTCSSSTGTSWNPSLLHGSWEESLGHQAASSAGTFLSVQARDTTSVPSQGTAQLLGSVPPHRPWEGPGGRARGGGGRWASLGFHSRASGLGFPVSEGRRAVGLKPEEAPLCGRCEAAGVECGGFAGPSALFLGPSGASPLTPHPLPVTTGGCGWTFRGTWCPVGSDYWETW